MTTIEKIARDFFKLLGKISTRMLDLIPGDSTSFNLLTEKEQRITLNYRDKSTKANIVVPIIINQKHLIILPEYTNFRFEYDADIKTISKASSNMISLLCILIEEESAIINALCNSGLEDFLKTMDQRKELHGKLSCYTDYKHIEVELTTLPIKMKLVRTDHDTYDSYGSHSSVPILDLIDRIIEGDVKLIGHSEKTL